MAECFAGDYSGDPDDVMRHCALTGHELARTPDLAPQPDAAAAADD